MGCFSARDFSLSHFSVFLLLAQAYEGGRESSAGVAWVWKVLWYPYVGGGRSDEFELEVRCERELLERSGDVLSAAGVSADTGMVAITDGAGIAIYQLSRCVLA